jgi:hypothetical protein
MGLVHVTRKGRLLNTLEKYYMYETAHPGVHMDITYEIQLNPYLI